MKTGWLNNGGWYHFSPRGAMQTGWIQDAGNWYYLKPNGSMAIGSMIIDGKISSFDNSGKWLGYVNNNQNNNNGQQSVTTNSSNGQTSANSNETEQGTKTTISRNHQNNTTSNGKNNRNINSNKSTSQVTTSSNKNEGNASLNNSKNTVANQNSYSNIINSNNNQAVTSNQTSGEFSIEDALKMISDYKGIAVTLTPSGPTSGIDGTYEKIHKDGKTGYYINSYLFNGQRVNNSGGILIFKDGEYKQFLQGHHPSDIDADEWIEKKEKRDVVVKDFMNHVQITHDGDYEYYYNGRRYNFYVTGEMEQGMAYRTFHAELFDRNGYYIETAADYMESANIRNH